MSHPFEPTSTADSRSSGVSARKLAANQANSQHSTGPTSDAGKAQSSQNALLHGLYSDALHGPAVLLGEERAQFEALYSGLWTKYRPADVHEELLVDRLSELLWRLARVNARGQAYFSERLKQGAHRAFANKESEAFMVEEGRLERAASRITRDLVFLKRYSMGPAERSTARSRQVQKEWEDFAEQELAVAKAEAVRRRSALDQAEEVQPKVASAPLSTANAEPVAEAEAAPERTAARAESSRPSTAPERVNSQPEAAREEAGPEALSPDRPAA
jgi:hypothetical protein